METGEGCFAWPFYSGTIIYTTYGDLLTNQYDFAKPPVTKLNNLDEVTITKTPKDPTPFDVGTIYR